MSPHTSARPIGSAPRASQLFARVTRLNVNAAWTRSCPHSRLPRGVRDYIAFWKGVDAASSRLDGSTSLTAMRVPTSQWSPSPRASVGCRNLPWQP